MSPARFRSLLTLIALEGGLACSSLFASPSEAQSAIWLGFSKMRLVLGGVAFLALLFPVAGAFYAWISPGGLKRISSRAHSSLERGDRLLGITLALGALVLLTAWGFLFSWLFVPAVLRWLLAWLGVSAAQSLAFLVLEFPVLYRQKQIAARIFTLPRWKNLDTTQHRVLLTLALVGVLYWAGFMYPNSLNSDAHTLQYSAGDEGIIYPILTHMTAPAESFRQRLYFFFLYEDYHYGFPFYFLSTLVLLPVQILSGGRAAEMSQINLLLLRQFISAAPLVLAAGLLVWLQTRLRSLWKPLALFGLLLVIPEVFNYNIQFWHPDGLTVLCVVLTLYFLDRDKLRFGSNFYWAAVFCGLASALRMYGFFFVFVLLTYFVAGKLSGKKTWRAILLHTFGFTVLMLAVFLLTSPYLFESNARSRAVAVLFSKTDEFSHGYEGIQDPQGLFQLGPAAALKWLSYPFAPPLYLGFLLLSLGAACLYGAEKFANRLIFLWILPPAVYLIWFVAVRSAHYWLPVMLPLYSAAFGLFGIPLAPPLRTITRTAAGLILVSLAGVSVFLILQYFV